MGNRQATDNRKSKTTLADDVTAVQDGDRKPQSQPEVSRKRRRGRGRKVTDVASSEPSGLRGPSHPELITTTTLDTGEDGESGSGNGNRRLLHLTIYRSYSGATSNGSAASHGIYAIFILLPRYCLESVADPVIGGHPLPLDATIFF